MNNGKPGMFRKKGCQGINSGNVGKRKKGSGKIDSFGLHTTCWRAPQMCCLCQRPSHCLSGMGLWPMVYWGARSCHWLAQRDPRKNLHLIANNLRFLILPWVQATCLASHLLSLNRRCISQDWHDLYGHPVYLLESFVETEGYKGICYQADNWICVGQTKALGNLSKSCQPVPSKKAVYVYPLT